ncbi:hypothetical protein [Vibrio intestinalis]|uniref:hypothetical protein n=1 Tax=Vibrio intestinalis TaxID=2933291 RepID=UPI0021A289D8|nr:hypothetical protein [Vibrio intestinalis]
MRKMMAQLMNRTAAPSSSPNTRPRQNQTKQWHSNGHTYYLLDTLKLCYQSHAGLVTYERVSQESIAPLCRELSRGNWVRPTLTAHMPSLFTLSVCGVSWEEHQGSTRVKAVPDAAAMRFEDIDRRATEAKFQSIYRRSDDAVTPFADIGEFDKGLRKVHNLSVNEFLEILLECNQAVPERLKQVLLIKPDNFEYRFTRSERQLLDQVSCAVTR